MATLISICRGVEVTDEYNGLGSVRGVVDVALEMDETRQYAPYGEPFGQTGTPGSVFGFTGEMTDENGLVFLRARYYVPEMGVWPSLDPVEDGNRYVYSAGSPINIIDPSATSPSCQTVSTDCPCGGTYSPGQQCCYNYDRQRAANYAKKHTSRANTLCC